MSYAGKGSGITEKDTEIGAAVCKNGATAEKPQREHPRAENSSCANWRRKEDDPAGDIRQRTIAETREAGQEIRGNYSQKGLHAIEPDLRITIIMLVQHTMGRTITNITITLVHRCHHRGGSTSAITIARGSHRRPTLMTAARRRLNNFEHAVTTAIVPMLLILGEMTTGITNITITLATGHLSDKPDEVIRKRSHDWTTLMVFARCNLSACAVSMPRESGKTFRGQLLTRRITIIMLPRYILGDMTTIIMYMQCTMGRTITNITITFGRSCNHRDEGIRRRSHGWTTLMVFAREIGEACRGQPPTRRITNIMPPRYILGEMITSIISSFAMYQVCNRFAIAATRLSRGRLETITSVRQRQSTQVIDVQIEVKPAFRVPQLT